MIPQKNRFIGNKPIERVYKTTRPHRAGAFNIRVKKGNNAEYKLAVVVSKKVNKSAVVRNRIRRRVFECVRTNLGTRSNLTGHEVIITVFDESVAKYEQSRLDKELNQLFSKAGI